MKKFLFVTILFVSCSIYSQVIKITSPSKDVEIEKGSDLIIKWEFENITPNDVDVKIELNGEKKSIIIESVNAMKREYKWKVDADSGEYKIFISGENLKSESESFKILGISELDEKKTTTELDEIKQNLNKLKARLENDDITFYDASLKAIDLKLRELKFTSKSDTTTINKLIVKVNKLDSMSYNQFEHRKLYFIGDAGVFKTFGSDSKTTSAGSIGMKYISVDDRLIIEATTVVFSYSDTVAAKYSKFDSTKGYMPQSNQSEFGDAILSPVISGKSIVSGNFDLQFYLFRGEGKFKEIADHRLGINIGLQVSSRYWSALEDQKDTSNKNIKTIQVTMLGFKAGLIYNLIPIKTRQKKDISFKLSLMFIGRHILGDILSQKDFQNNLVQTKNLYFGLEAGFDFEIKGIGATFRFPVILNSQLPGLSKGKIITGLSVTSGIPLDDLFK